MRNLFSKENMFFLALVFITAWVTVIAIFLFVNPNFTEAPPAGCVDCPDPQPVPDPVPDPIPDPEPVIPESPELERETMEKCDQLYRSSPRRYAGHGVCEVANACTDGIHAIWKEANFDGPMVWNSNELERCNGGIPIVGQ